MEALPAALRRAAALAREEPTDRAVVVLVAFVADVVFLVVFFAVAVLFFAGDFAVLPGVFLVAAKEPPSVLNPATPRTARCRLGGRAGPRTTPSILPIRTPYRPRSGGQLRPCAAPHPRGRVGRRPGPASTTSSPSAALACVRISSARKRACAPQGPLLARRPGRRRRGSSGAVSAASSGPDDRRPRDAELPTGMPRANTRLAQQARHDVADRGLLGAALVPAARAIPCCAAPSAPRQPPRRARRHRRRGRPRPRTEFPGTSRLVGHRDEHLAPATRDARATRRCRRGIERRERIVDQQHRRLPDLGLDGAREAEPQAQRRRPRLPVRRERARAEVADGEVEVVAVGSDEGRPADELVGPTVREPLAERLLEVPSDAITFGRVGARRDRSPRAPGTPRRPPGRACRPRRRAARINAAPGLDAAPRPRPRARREPRRRPIP